MGGFLSNLDFGRPLVEGAPLEVIPEQWGPLPRQGKSWLLVGGKGAAEWGGHYALFVDVGGQCSFTESGGEDRIPSIFVGILIQLGLFEKGEESKRMRIACPIVQAYNGVTDIFDHGLCEKIIPLEPRLQNDHNSATPREWAYALEAVANDVFRDITARQGEEDPTDETYQNQINEELAKANWKERVDFTIPKEFQAKRWDESVNCHVFVFKLATKLGLKWPLETPVTPKYEGWLLDTIVAAPGRSFPSRTVCEPRLGLAHHLLITF